MSNEYLDIAMNKVIGQEVSKVLQEIQEKMSSVSVIDELNDLKTAQVMKAEFLGVINSYVKKYEEEA